MKILVVWFAAAVWYRGSVHEPIKRAYLSQMKKWGGVWLLAFVAAFATALSALLLPADSQFVRSLAYAMDGGAGWFAGKPEWMGAVVGFEVAGLSGSVAGLALARFLLALAVMFAGVAAVAFVVHFFPVVRAPAMAVCAIVLAALAASGLWNAWETWKLAPRAPRLLLPVDLIDLARPLEQKAPLFTNPSAAAILRILAPEMETEKWELPSAALTRPDAWRSLDSENRFGAVLLMGDSREFAPLREFLMASPAWKPAAIDAHGVLFERSGGGADPVGRLWEPMPPPVGLSHRERGVWLARQAEILDGLGSHGDARRQFAEALRLAPEHPGVAALYASFLAGRGQWVEAAAEARRALKLVPGHIPALQVLVQCELSMGDGDAAWAAAERLIESHPDDVFSLFLAAKAANAAGMSYMEVPILERILPLCPKAGLSDASFRIYLGQAYARQGFERAALEQWRMALASGTLVEEQENHLRELMLAMEAQAGVAR